LLKRYSAQAWGELLQHAVAHVHLEAQVDGRRQLATAVLLAARVHVDELGLGGLLELQGHGMLLAER
jgi:hypothetical protein